MERSIFAAYVADYIIGNVLSVFVPESISEKSPTLVRWFGAGCRNGIASALETKLEQNLGVLKIMGIVSADGSVSVEGVKTFLEDAFASEPEVSFPLAFVVPFMTESIKFKASDKDVFVDGLCRVEE